MSEFLVNGNPQNVPKKKGGNNMFYAATKEQIEQLHPELINYEPEKNRCFYKYEDGTIRWFDRIMNYYFSDKPWGLEKELLAEGIDQEFTEDYISLNIRNSIKCPDGWSFWCLDYAAEELRLGAINTKGKAFMDAFTSGKDVHTLVGINTFGEEKFYSDKKKYRKISKTLNFNMQYGGTAFGVARMLGVSQEEAQKIFDDYMVAMADHFKEQDLQVKATHINLCEHTMFGLPIRLKRYYMNPNDRKNVSQGERLAKNCRIQGTGADILSIAFMRLWKQIWNELGNPEDYIRFQITVHDEIDFLVRNDVAHILIPKVIECMTFQDESWQIALIVGLSCGPTFGQQYEWNYDTKENGYKVLGPALEEEKPKKQEVKTEPEVKEDYFIEL